MQVNGLVSYRQTKTVVLKFCRRHRSEGLRSPMLHRVQGLGATDLCRWRLAPLGQKKEMEKEKGGSAQEREQRTWKNYHAKSKYKTEK